MNEQEEQPQVAPSSPEEAMSPTEGAAQSAQDAAEAAAPAEPAVGLAVGKRLKEPFRHPTKHYIILPKFQALNEAMIEAIRLMGAERQAISCLGEPIPEDFPVEDDVLKNGPIAIQNIELNSRVMRNGRDALAMFVGLLAIFAFALKNTMLFVLMAISLVGFIALSVMTVLTTKKIQQILERIDAERARRAEGDRKLAEAAQKAGVHDRSGKLP